MIRTQEHKWLSTKIGLMSLIRSKRDKKRKIRQNKKGLRAKPVRVRVILLRTKKQMF